MCHVSCVCGLACGFLTACCGRRCAPFSQLCLLLVHIGEPRSVTRAVCCGGFPDRAVWDVQEMMMVTQYFDMLKDIGVSSRYQPASPC